MPRRDSSRDTSSVLVNNPTCSTPVTSLGHGSSSNSNRNLHNYSDYSVYDSVFAHNLNAHGNPSKKTRSSVSNYTNISGRPSFLSPDSAGAHPQTSSDTRHLSVPFAITTLPPTGRDKGRSKSTSRILTLKERLHLTSVRANAKSTKSSPSEESGQQSGSLKYDVVAHIDSTNPSTSSKPHGTASALINAFEAASTKTRKKDSIVSSASAYLFLKQQQQMMDEYEESHTKSVNRSPKTTYKLRKSSTQEVSNEQNVQLTS